jgi:hypothetical protein
LATALCSNFACGRSPNFALKLSEKPHLLAKRLTIRRLIAT